MRFEATKHDSDDRRSDMMRRKLLESTVTTIRVTQNFETIVLVGILLEINKKKKKRNITNKKNIINTMQFLDNAAQSLQGMRCEPSASTMRYTMCEWIIMIIYCTSVQSEREWNLSKIFKKNWWVRSGEIITIVRSDLCIGHRKEKFLLMLPMRTDSSREILGVNFISLLR